MNLSFDKSFYKSLDKLDSKSAARSMEQIIASIQNAQSIQDIRNVKKLQGFKNFYRVRIGNYRLGFELENSQSIRLIVIAHRKDIYRHFP